MKLKCVFVLSHCVALKCSFHYSKPPFLHKDLCCRCHPGSHLLPDSRHPVHPRCDATFPTPPNMDWKKKNNSHPARGFSARSGETCMQPAGGWRDEWVNRSLEFCSEWIRPCQCFPPDHVTFVVQYFADHGWLVLFTLLPSAWRPGQARLVSFYPPFLWAVQVRTVTTRIWFFEEHRSIPPSFKLRATAASNLVA